MMSNSGISRLVGLLRPFVAIPIMFSLFPFHQTVPQLPQGPEMRQSVCGMFRQETAFVS